MKTVPALMDCNTRGMQVCAPDAGNSLLLSMGAQA